MYDPMGRCFAYPTPEHMYVGVKRPKEGISRPKSDRLPKFANQNCVDLMCLMDKESGRNVCQF